MYSQPQQCRSCKLTVTFGKHVMTYEAYSTTTLDYWVCTSERGSPNELVEAYASVTGYVPMTPEYGLGYWQCKLRYQNQEELLGVAREYKKRNLPIDVIVCDFFHWFMQGDWSFDPVYWPDPGKPEVLHLRSRCPDLPMLQTR